MLQSFEGHQRLRQRYDETERFARIFVDQINWERDEKWEKYKSKSPSKLTGLTGSAGRVGLKFMTRADQALTLTLIHFQFLG